MSTDCPKKMWDTIRLAMHDGIMPEKKAIQLKLDNLIVTDNDAVSHALTGHLTRMGIQSAVDDAPNCTTILNQVRNDIVLSGTNALEIEEVIFDLKNSESIEVDDIKLSLLKHYMVDVRVLNI
jgi:hypothetical protein